MGSANPMVTQVVLGKITESKTNPRHESGKGVGREKKRVNIHHREMRENGGRKVRII